MTDPAHITLMNAVARHFFGEPNAQLSKNAELRFGTHGSKSVDLKNGRWFDHEANQGGGPLDLIRRETGLTEARECYTWAEQQGFWINGGGPTPGPSKVVATYDYRDEGGALLYQKCRYAPGSPQRFSMRRPDGNGGWIYKSVLEGVRRVIYRLPEVVETISQQQTIYLVEGEKDVDNCWKIGISATCNYDGGNKWNDQQTKTFDGADVCIITDNDEVGREHGNLIAAKLSGVAKKVRVFAMAALWPQCPPKGDMSDWIEQTNGTADQFYTLIAQAKPELQPQPEPDPVTASALGEWDAGDDVEPPPPRGWLLGNVFARTFLSSLIAEGGRGKTALRYAQYLSLATARPLTGEHVFQRCRVLIVSLEDDDKELRRRVLAARLCHKVSLDEVRGWLFLAAPGIRAGKLMVLDAKGKPALGTLATTLEAVIVARKIDLVALDPFIKTHGVLESDNNMIDMVAQLLTDLAAKHNIAVDIPHHARKGAGEPGDAERGRGASAAKDAARLVYSLTCSTPSISGSATKTPARPASVIPMRQPPKPAPHGKSSNCSLPTKPKNSAASSSASGSAMASSWPRTTTARASASRARDFASTPSSGQERKPAHDRARHEHEQN